MSAGGAGAAAAAIAKAIKASGLIVHVELAVYADEMLVASEAR